MDNNKDKAPKAEQMTDNDFAPEIADNLEEVVDSPETEPNEVETLTMQLEATQEALEKEKKECLFLMAEFDNYRKRQKNRLRLSKTVLKKCSQVFSLLSMTSNAASRLPRMPKTLIQSEKAWNSSTTNSSNISNLTALRPWIRPARTSIQNSTKQSLLFRLRAKISRARLSTLPRPDIQSTIKYCVTPRWP